MARRRKVWEHENHDRWLVSYADFITLLFAFFVVMYSLSSVNEGKYRVLSDSLVQAFRNVDATEDGTPALLQPVTVVPRAAPKRTASDDEAAKRRRQVSQTMHNMAGAIRRVLQPLTENGQVSVSEGAFGISVEINASLLFSPGDSTLGQEAVTALRAVAGVIAQENFPVLVEGHTDNIPINTFRFPSNWELSAARASSVVRLFIDSGVAPERLTAAGYADQRPVASNTSDVGRARNRRVAIMIESRAAEATPAAPGAIADDDPISSILPPDPPPPPAFEQIEVR
ncbi:flagellar motor protein MotD [Betaproteobacteria bacterium]|nr:flagellar motor protein MotD [Betaproteobacteria bacterium]GHT94329.1 flagellar motor protein MotD [Betaproteobacteria bacterium]GHU01375.1 flagellar motor protein MotD [Betaproteobacteria bacterium]GHU10336.1 flagellar motor protein MotD [Betaproteobacteria bacterium]GHU24256.1 flagellar motor protein MotD [Betaproteobacteria bacterium]